MMQMPRKLINTYVSDNVNMCVFLPDKAEKEYMYEEKHILYIYVHESSDVHKTAYKIYDRNEDGDFDITNNTTLISNLYIRKRSRM